MNLINAFSRWVDLENIKILGGMGYGPRTPWMPGYNIYPWLNGGNQIELWNAPQDKTSEEDDDTLIHKPENAVNFQNLIKLQYLLHTK